MFILRVQSSYLIFTKKCHTANDTADGRVFFFFSSLCKVFNVSLNLLETLKWRSSMAQRCRMLGHWVFSHLEHVKGMFCYCNSSSCSWRLLLFVAESLSLWVQRDHLGLQRTNASVCPSKHSCNDSIATSCHS